MVVVVAFAPSALPGRAGAAPAATPSPGAVVAPVPVADVSGPTAVSDSSDGGSPVALLVAATASLGVGGLLLATRQPNPLGRRRRHRAEPPSA
jgi:hypothetical protein